jgi:hypothetical protein
LLQTDTSKRCSQQPGQLIRHYESSRYARRILGYHFTGQNSGEWFPLAYRQKGLDYSRVNANAFRKWLQAKYGSDDRLAAAWGTHITFETASIPLAEPGRFPIQSGTITREAFYRLPQEQDWIDYSEYTSDITVDRLLGVARAAKEETHGKKLVALFYGYIFDLPGSMTGHLRFQRPAGSPDVDVLAAPISYLPLSERMSGGAGGAMGAIDSVAAHGKLWMNEDDLRTDLAGASSLPDAGYNGNLAAANAEETSNLLQRNLASVLVHRAGTWWMDLNAVGAFNDPGIWDIMSKIGEPEYRGLYSHPTRYEPEVAVIVDERSVLYQKSDWQMVALGRAYVRNTVAKVGASIGYYYLDDFINDIVPRCKVYLFANTFFLDDRQVAAIRSRLTREGATAIWLYAPGYLGPSGPSLSRSEALTGIHMAMASGQCNNSATVAPGTLSVPPFTPRLVVSDPEATVLGRYACDQTIGRAKKRLGRETSVILGDFGWDAEFLRSIMRQAGVHIWIDGGEVVHTDGHVLAINSRKGGLSVIHLPDGVRAVPFPDHSARQDGRDLTVSFSAGQTLWFRISGARR